MADCLNCSNPIIDRKANAKYCSEKCCIDFNKNKTKNRKGKITHNLNSRHCSCGNKLSRYNLDEKCWACQYKLLNEDSLILIKLNE